MMDFPPPLLCHSVPTQDGLTTRSRYHYQPPIQPALTEDSKQSAIPQTGDTPHNEPNHDRQEQHLAGPMHLTGRRRSSLGHHLGPISQSPSVLSALSIFPFENKGEIRSLAEKLSHHAERTTTQYASKTRDEGPDLLNDILMLTIEASDRVVSSPPEFSTILDSILSSVPEWNAELDVDVLTSMMSATEKDLSIFKGPSIESAIYSDDDFNHKNENDDNTPPLRNRYRDMEGGIDINFVSSGSLSTDSIWTPLHGSVNRSASLLSPMTSLPWNLLAEVSGPIGTLYSALRCNEDSRLAARRTGSDIKKDDAMTLPTDQSCTYKERCDFGRSILSPAPSVLTSSQRRISPSEWRKLDIEGHASTTLFPLYADANNTSNRSSLTSPTSHAISVRRRSESVQPSKSLHGFRNTVDGRERRSPFIAHRISSSLCCSQILTGQSRSDRRIHRQHQIVRETRSDLDSVKRSEEQNVTNGCRAFIQSSLIMPSVVYALPSDSCRQKPTSAVVKKPSVKALRRRLERLSQRRGSLELDKVIGAFCRQNISLMTDEQLKDFEVILQVKNFTLFSILSGQCPIPSELQPNEALPMLLTFINPKHPNLASKKKPRDQAKSEPSISAKPSHSSIIVTSHQ